MSGHGNSAEEKNRGSNWGGGEYLGEKSQEVVLTFCRLSEVSGELGRSTLAQSCPISTSLTSMLLISSVDDSNTWRRLRIMHRKHLRELRGREGPEQV